MGEGKKEMEAHIMMCTGRQIKRLVDRERDARI